MFSFLRSLLFFYCCLFFFPPGSCFAAPNNQQLRDSLAQLQTRYEKLHSLQFDFAQITDSGGRSKEGNGFAAFYRTASNKGTSSGIMRWDYTTPTPQVILNNGVELSIYTPMDKQLIITPIQDQDADITFALFTGSKQLSDEFDLIPADTNFLIQEPPDQTRAIQLVPKTPHPQLKRLQLWYDSTYQLRRLILEDHFGALTELSFSNMRFDTLPAKSAQQAETLLKLDLAPGTEIIRQ
ncbi:outer membrane lipoprotein carrier protein LolA [Desulfobulbus rhabdoformis]|jgi:outer membrane lipoprotein carrier protein|uniref:LolA family protein n=1 Tax=Desulfobulbus rhabdoformis TaxID=34032 RepID=UPI00196313EB|nr:outer membrane lipoprotein carrier protein LolA [Desulfobulbus rhabdoformis]MBM9614331.1 outer membrane lipoprotein carrier protein LolA [Desulfobulbus rhabdoformis]